MYCCTKNVGGIARFQQFTSPIDGKRQAVRDAWIRAAGSGGYQSVKPASSAIVPGC